MSVTSVDHFRLALPGAGDQTHRGRRAPPLRDSGARPPPVEIAFLINYGVPIEMLRYAAAVARRQGVSSDAALLAEGLVAEDVFYRALADHLGVRFLDGAVELAPGALASADQGYVALCACPENLRWLFAPTGAQIFRLMSVARTATGRPFFAVTTRARFLAAIRGAASPQEVARAASLSAERAEKDLCVRNSLRQGLLAHVSAVFLALVACLFVPAEPVNLFASLILAAAFLSSVCLRLCACAASLAESEPEELIEEVRLPTYTVIIPLYREAALAQQLARAMDCLDYPRAKLDIKFVVEIDDEETGAALRAHPPHAPHEIIVAPEGGPRTKPRALNIAMPFARGSLVVVFDAEDIPNRLQLRRAATLFAAAPQNLACLQASLVIDNCALNWITAIFALDYAALFDVYNKGLAALGLPIFLGGTSNHFRIEALREIGFWDAYNVTEDADVGLRLARAGYAVRTFNSATFEEAPACFASLLNQRTRWFKGWMQTAMVHCRRPGRLYADLGATRASAVIAMFLGGVMSPLFGPFLTGRLFYDAFYGALLAPKTPFETACSALWCFLAASGAAALVWPLLIGMRRRRLVAQGRAMLFLPLWLLMLSIAGWRAFFELWRKPFHWEKTAHGVTTRGNLDQSGEEPLLEREAGA